MANQITDPEHTDLQSAQLDGGNLPSSVDQRTVELSNWELNEERQGKYFKDGKAYGRFDNIDGVFEALKSIEDKYANVMRDIKKPQTPETQTPQVNTQLLESLIPEVLNNNLQITPEIEAKAQEAGIDIRDLKLGAIELRESMSRAHAVVGGEAEYNAMLAWGKENLTHEQKLAFDQGLASGMGEFAIKGLYAEYKATNPNPAPTTDRLRGDNSASTGSTGGYTTREEIMRDRAYLNSRQGKSDTAARSAHERKLSRTDDSIVFGR